MNARLLVALLASALLLDCTSKKEEIPAPFAAFYGDLVTTSAVLAVPGQRWLTGNELAEECPNAAWGFRGIGTLLFHVAEPLEEQIVVTLSPSRERDLGVAARFEGLDREVVQQDSGTLQITLPTAHLDGTQELQLGPSNPGQGAYLCFDRLAFRATDGDQVVAPDHRQRQLRIAAFLTQDTLGKDNVKAGGMLFVGPDAIEREIEVAREGSASFALENWSGQPATFRLGPTGSEQTLELAPGGSGSLELPLQSGRHRIHLGVEGGPLGLFVWGAPHLRPLEPEDLPPVFLITLDTTRRDALSVYGGSTPTPNIAAFAEQAVVYDNAVATAPWTLPSHTSMFTGLYPSHHGNGVRVDHLGREIPTLAETFLSRGYRTAGFVGGALAASQYGIARGFQLYVDPPNWEVVGEKLTSAAIAFLESAKGEPTFTFINYFDAHAAYRAPEPYRSLLGVPQAEAAIADHPEFGPFSKGDIGAWTRIINGQANVTPEDIAYVTAAYHAEIAYVDHQLGLLFDALRRLDLYDRAMIVLVGDHGELLGEHGFFSHACRLDAELIDVPLLIKWPHQKTPRRSQELVSQVDLFPTLLALLRADPGTVDGRELLRDREQQTQRAPALFEEHEYRIHPLFPHMTIAPHIYGRERPEYREVMWDGGSACERREDGPWQQTPCQAEASTMLAEVSAALSLNTQRKTSGPRGPEGLTPEEAEKLKTLGYMK